MLYQTQTTPLAAPTCPAAPDDVAIMQLRAADPAGLATLFKRHGRAAFGEAYRLLGDAGPAEATVQDVFLAIWGRPDAFRPGPGQAREWFLAAVRARCPAARATPARGRRAECDAHSQELER